jgi:hypothetical protein
MTFLETLQAHKGGLICLKTELYWYGGRDSDGTPGRVCLILDAATSALHRQAINAVSKAGSLAYDVVLLLVDGQPQWVLVAEKDVELL